MKNLQTFENYNDIDPQQYPFLKNYGEPFPLSKLSKGDKVTYIATTYIVDDANEYVIKLISLAGDKSFSVNQSMFNQKGAILRVNKPKNYKG